MPSSDDESMQDVHDDFEANLPPEVVKMREQTAAFLADLERMSKMSPPMEWWFQRSQAYDRMFVERHDLIWRASFWMMVRLLVWAVALGALMFGAANDWDWATLLGMACLGGLSAAAIIAPINRARAFRSGYMERGKDDSAVVKQVCGDPVCQEETQREFLMLDAAAMRAL